VFLQTVATLLQQLEATEAQVVELVEQEQTQVPAVMAATVAYFFTTKK
jgi:hypothetical protein